MIEPYLAGEYVKFNSNAGYELDGRVEAAPVIAFGHWVWEKSGHRFLLCDLQGSAPFMD